MLTSDASHGGNPTNGFCLGALLHDLRLSRGFVAERLQVSKEAIDNWCSGRYRPSLANLGALIELLEQQGAAPELLRELLVNGMVSLGLSEGLADAYFGFRRHPRRHNAFAVVAQDLQMESQMFTVVAEVRAECLRAGRECIVLDCGSTPSIRWFYLEEVIPTIAPAGLILSGSLSRAELGGPAFRLAKLGIPTVYLHQRPRILPHNAAFVGLGDYASGRRAAASVVAAGYERAAVILFDGVDNHLARAEGFRAGLAAANQQRCDVENLFLEVKGNTFNHDGLAAPIVQFLLRSRPDVVFAPSTTTALALIRALKSVSDARLDSLTCVTIAYGGWSSLLLERVSHPRMIVVRLPIRSLARRGVEMLCKLSGSQWLPIEERTVDIGDSDD